MAEPAMGEGAPTHGGDEEHIDRSRCPICRNGNRCGLAGNGPGGEACWCFEVAIPTAILEQVPKELAGMACICPECAAGG